MNCKNCGFLLAENEQYCRNCGAPVNANNSQTINTGIQQDMTQNVNNQNISNSGVVNNNLNPQQVQNNNLINNEVGQSANIGLTPNNNNISQIEQLNINQDNQNNINQSMTQQSIQDNSMNQNMYTQPLNRNDYSDHNFGSNSDQELIDAYIGDKADKIKNKKFSFATFFFGVIYLFYRKMNNIASYWFAFNIIINTISNLFNNTVLQIIILLVSLSVNIVLAIMFKKLYLKDVQSKVNKIKIENNGKSREEILNICRQKGGVWKPAIILGIVIYIALFTLIAITTYLQIEESTSYLNDNVTENDNSNTIDSNYNTDYNSQKFELKYEVPSGFVKDSTGNISTTTTEIITYKNTDQNSNFINFGITQFKINTSEQLAISSYRNEFKTSFQSALDNVSDYTYSNGNETTKNINGKQWNVVNDVITSKSKNVKINIFIYTIKYNNSTYVVYGCIVNDMNSVANVYNNFINSLNF